jgi:predicted DNA-binding transcriptional regulator AlpA
MNETSGAVLSPQRPKRGCSYGSHVEPLALSASDLAALLSVSVRQIWAMHATGTLGPVPVSLGERLTRWDAQEIRDWWIASRAAGRPIPRTEWLRTRQDGAA